MRADGAYEDEMNETVLFQSALRAAVPTQPDPRIAAELVPRLAAVARAASVAAANGTPQTHPAPRRRHRWTLVAKVGIAAATIPLLFAGLAIAGVTVPAAARDAFEAVGVELPNQPESESAKGGTKDGAPGTSEDPGAPATGDLPSEASPKARANRKAHGLDGDKPGRRVRRHGQGPVPGPASAPEGRALGYANKEAAGSGASGASEGKGNASAQAGTGNSGGGAPAGRGKP